MVIVRTKRHILGLGPDVKSEKRDVRKGVLGWESGIESIGFEVGVCSLTIARYLLQRLIPLEPLRIHL